MTILLGYARVSEWELRLLERSPSSTARPLSLSEQEARLRRVSEASGVDLHGEVTTDSAPGGLDASWDPSSFEGTSRPGQARLRQLLFEVSWDAVVVVSSLDRMSTLVDEVEWLLTGSAGAPPVFAITEGVTTVDTAGLESAGEFLRGAAAERLTRRSRSTAARSAPDQSKDIRAYEEGMRWERAAPRTRSRDSLEARRLAGLPNGRRSIAMNPGLAARIRAMRDRGMTLQAIADTLNAEHVPTIRGGAKWRRSSLQNLPSAADQEDGAWFP
jgi:DNA invertase Pin-like site-specific DNA recombinase